MKAFINNHKNQSFLITLFVFIPLFFILIYSKNFLHIQSHNNIKENKFNIAIKQFIQNSSEPKAKEQTQEIIKKIEPRKEKSNTKVKKTNSTINTKVLNQSKKDTNLQQPIVHKQNTQSNSYKSVSSSSDDEFLKEIKSAIDKALIYPKQAKKMRMSGEILIEFTWTKEKKLENLKILKPSKYHFLNKNALETIYIASKKFPQYKKTFHIKIPLVYKIE